ncbi:MAG: BamA/TamA family outer membrane protein [Bryobacteraceae bacterium]|jgi:hypothetical protein
MKVFLVLAFAASLWGQTQTADPPLVSSSASPVLVADINTRSDANVNSRYTVESVGITNPRRYHIPRILIDDMQNLVGRRFNSDLFQSLASRLSNELHGHEVLFKLSRGTDPEHVRVTFEIHGPRTGFDVDLPKFVYNSKQGLSGEGDAMLNVGANTFTFGLLSDDDSSIPRTAGVRVRYDRLEVGSERVQLGFEFDSYHEQYNSATQTAAAGDNDLSVLYRNRQNYEPTATVALAGPLTWTVGVSFQQFQQQYPSARAESSDAIVNSLRYDRSWADSTGGKHRFSASYTLHVATSFLGSAYAYTRHAVDATYHWHRGRQSVEGTFLGGAIAGNAPLFERFVLGNSVTLRGWDKYELDPLGDSRVVYGSASYGFSRFRAFYDTGAVWNKGQGVSLKQSAGVGVKVEGVLLAVAFPVRHDRLEAVLIAGMNF